MLLTGKRIGLSFEEMNVLGVDDFAGLVDGWANNEDSDEPREATQDDINAMLG